MGNWNEGMGEVMAKMNQLDEILKREQEIANEKLVYAEQIIAEIRERLAIVNKLELPYDQKKALFGFASEFMARTPAPTKPERDPNAPKRGRKPGQVVKCSICKQEGHTARTCPNKPAEAPAE